MSQAGGFVGDYARAFREYLSRTDEVGLQEAYELGRRAVQTGVGAIELATIHHVALADELARAHDPAAAARLVSSASTFFCESVSTFEMVQRGYFEAQQILDLERRHGEQLQGLAAAGVAVNAAGSVDEIGHVVASAAVAIVAADFASAALESSPGDVVRTVSRSVAARDGRSPEDARSLFLAGESHVETLRAPTRLKAHQVSGADSELRSGMWLGAPVVRRDGSRIGALQLYRADADGFSENDETIVAQLAHMASVAVENRQRYESERGIAETLQRSLLPPSLPAIPYVDLAALYRPWSASLEVGGDFYDVFQSSADVWSFAIGDVCGKGVQAAALTGLARHTIRAVALADGDPAAVLRALNSAVHRAETGDFCTVVYGLLRPRPGGLEIVVACGGHPAPLVVRRDGTVDETDCRGGLIGVLDDPSPAPTTVVLRDGEQLVLYTDGLVETARRRGRESLGERDVLEVLSGCAGMSASDTVAALGEYLDRFHDAARRDDVAALVLRASPQS